MRLYFGRIAPVEPQKTQINGGGWSWRFKVRIFDKHPESKVELPDEDLPWAQVLLPVTAGSGAANYSVSPAINQGDTVSIAYYDEDETMPIITGILPRTQRVPVSNPSEDSGYIPHTGFTDNKGKSKWVDSDESNENNEESQPSTRSDRFSAALGDTLTPADTCDPNAYKTNAVTSEINNLFNQIQQFADDAAYIETLIVGTIDRVHALTNPYVGEMFFNLYESLVPVLNAGLKALYEEVYAIVLAATGSTEAARLAAEAALIALQPAIIALQEAILFLANEVVKGLLVKVEDLIRDTIQENNNFSDCGSSQFVGALVNSIIQDIDLGIDPLLRAIQVILSGGFTADNAIRSSIDIVRDFGGGLLAPKQGSNKCGGLVREYAYGIGERSDVGDILEGIMDIANTGKSLVNLYKESGEEVSEFQESFGDFPFLSSDTGFASELDDCSTDPPETCLPPEVKIFGGRGEGGSATAKVGRYIETTDDRTVSDKMGGVVSIKVDDPGKGYIYPPFVEVKDNCGLGIGCVARSVIKNGKIKKIYIVTPGSSYPSDGTDLFVVETVEILDTGINYTPGIYPDEFGGEYEVITDDDGRVTDIIPITLVQVDDEPTINIPEIVPAIPDGGTIDSGNVFDQAGNFVYQAKVGVGLRYKPILIPLPTAREVLDGEIPTELKSRFSENEILQVIDCIGD